MMSDASCVRVGRKSDANFGRKIPVSIYLFPCSDANRGKSSQVQKQEGEMLRGEQNTHIGGDRRNPDFASSVGMTGFFASDLRPLASEPSRGLAFCVRRTIGTINTTRNA
jgi:hypothetical protein